MPFHNDERTDSTPKRADESSFQFLDRSARPEIGRVRAFLIDALHRYPASDHDELVSRLRSGREKEFQSATFELLLHEGLTRLGYRVSCHPDPGNGSRKRPDFLVSDPDHGEFYLEAVLASENDGSDPAAEAMKDATLGRLNAAPHHAFMIEVFSEGDPQSQPSSNNLIRSVHGWLDALDADSLIGEAVSRGLDAMPTMTWSHGDWELTIRAIPLSEEKRGRMFRLIGIGGTEGGIVNMWEPLRDPVRKKATRYGVLEKPYIIAVNANVGHLDRIDELQALFGEEYISVEVTDNQEVAELRRYPNGAWFGPQGPQNRRVTAVWLFNDLSPYSIVNRRSTLYENPWADSHPPARMQQMPVRRIEQGRMVDIPGTDLATLFGLPENWPEG